MDKITQQIYMNTQPKMCNSALIIFDEALQVPNKTQFIYQQTGVKPIQANIINMSLFNEEVESNVKYDTRDHTRDSIEDCYLEQKDLHLKYCYEDNIKHINGIIDHLERVFMEERSETRKNYTGFLVTKDDTFEEIRDAMVLVKNTILHEHEKSEKNMYTLESLKNQINNQNNHIQSLKNQINRLENQDKNTTESGYLIKHLNKVRDELKTSITENNQELNKYQNKNEDNTTEKLIERFKYQDSILDKLSNNYNQMKSWITNLLHANKSAILDVSVETSKTKYILQTNFDNLDKNLKYFSNLSNKFTTMESQLNDCDNNCENSSDYHINSITAVHDSSNNKTNLKVTESTGIYNSATKQLNINLKRFFRQINLSRIKTGYKCPLLKIPENTLLMNDKKNKMFGDIFFSQRRYC